MVSKWLYRGGMVSACDQWSLIEYCIHSTQVWYMVHYANPNDSSLRVVYHTNPAVFEEAKMQNLCSYSFNLRIPKLKFYN